MSNTKYVSTPRGTKLPLLNLKGKDYLQAAYRLVWLVEECPNYETSIDMLKLTDDFACTKVTLSIFDATGKVVKKVSDIKTEYKKDFHDFVEKSVTGALSRCLAQAGYGTQFTVQDFDEGERITDSPLEVPKKTETVQGSTPINAAPNPTKSASNGFKPKSVKPNPVGEWS